MGRCVADVALMLDGGAGCDITDPLSFPHNGDRFLDALEHTEMPKRVAFSADLGVVLMEDEVASICESAAERFSEIGAHVDHLTRQVINVRTYFTETFCRTFADACNLILHQHDT